MYYKIAGYPFALEVCSETLPELAANLRAGLKVVLKTFQLGSEPVEPTAPHDLFFSASDVGRLQSSSGSCYHHLTIELFAPAQDIPFSVLLQDYESQIVNQAVREADLHLWVHGACAYRDGEVIFLVAPSGTGKTTLSLGLTQYGYRLVTDDIIMYDLASRSYVPMPRSPKLGGDAAQYLVDVGLELPTQATGVEPYVVLADKYWQRTPISDPPSRVYFMTRDANLPPGLAEVDISSALIAILPQSNLVAIDPQLTMAVEFFASTRFMNLNLSYYPDDLRLIAQA